jgi:hypothetical protein
MRTTPIRAKLAMWSRQTARALMPTNLTTFVRFAVSQMMNSPILELRKCVLLHMRTAGIAAECTCQREQEKCRGTLLRSARSAGKVN